MEGLVENILLILVFTSSTLGAASSARPKVRLEDFRLWLEKVELMEEEEEEEARKKWRCHHSGVM